MAWQAPWSTPAMVRPCADYPSRPIGRVVVLEHGRNPSTDLYLKPRLSRPEWPQVEYVDIASRDPDGFSFDTPDGSAAFVVICRYITGPWLRCLAAAEESLAGVAFFTDDDLPAATQDTALPLRYRRKIRRLYGQHAESLSKIASQLWFSTEALAAKYAGHGAEVLDPTFLEPRNDRPFRWFYHGTAAHEREMRWLVEVVAEVHRQEPDALFEVFGDQSIRRLFHRIERVIVLHPLGWTDYLSYASASSQCLGLAPLLPSDVNAARSPTKFFDIARLGAAGLFSDVPPYRGFVRDGIDGLLLPNRPETWSEAVLALAEDEPRRAQLAGKAAARCRDIAISLGPLPANGARPA